MTRPTDPSPDRDTRPTDPSPDGDTGPTGPSPDRVDAGVTVSRSGPALDRDGLTESDLGPDPIVAFSMWLAEAVAAELPEPTAMVVATSTPDGVPSARNVLLKGIDERGFVFYTNQTSRKGSELSANPRAALVFLWKGLERQVLVTGRVVTVGAAEADSYFATRPRGSQLSAWASRQSTVIAGRETLEAWWVEAEDEFRDRPVPRPPFWGGYRVVPDTIEFWHGRPSRLHDRLRYRRTAPAGAWILERLSP